MADDKKFTNPDYIDPAVRASLGVSEAAESTEEAEDIVVLDAELKKKAEERKEAIQREAAKMDTARPVTEERAATPIVEVMSKRNDARLLVITRDTLIFNDGSHAARKIEELSRMFAEVHVIVINQRKEGVKELVRRGDSIWIYPTNSRIWHFGMLDARKVAKKELTFGNGFRADIILAKDPFEAGLAGELIAHRYDRPFQVHVEDDFFDPLFKDLDTHNPWRLIMADHVLAHTHCVRTSSVYLKGLMEEKYKNLHGVVDLFPTYHDLTGWKDAPITESLKERYPQFKFTLLTVSSMNDLSHTQTAIDGLFYLMRQYRTIGLIVIGDGPLRESLEKIVADYGLSSQIIFEDAENIDLLSAVKTADVLINTSEETGSTEAVLMAGACEIPMVCGSRGIVSELFIDEESVLLCAVDDPVCFGEKVNVLLNNNPLREKLKLNAQNAVFDSIEQDYGTYLAAYRASIESCLVAEVREE